jgi:hypothetical protein
VTWVDLDDFEELPGSPEIETFPTVIVVKDTAVLFIGAIKPNKESLEGLISAVTDRAPVPEHAELGRNLRSVLIKKSFLGPATAFQHDQVRCPEEVRS